MKTLAVMLLVAGTLMAQSGVKGAPPAAGKVIKWETDLPAALKRAKAEHKLVFMDVWTDWCGWCIKLQKDTFPSPEAQAALARMVPLSLKTQLSKGQPTENKFIEEKYKVEAYPMLIILDADGKEVARQAGFLQPQPFAAWLDQALAASKK